jgi:hypothetical protein
MLFHTDNFSFFISIVVNMRNSDFFTGFVKLSILYVHKQQTEKFFFCFVDLYDNIYTFYLSLMKEF